MTDVIHQNAEPYISTNIRTGIKLKHTFRNEWKKMCGHFIQTNYTVKSKMHFRVNSEARNNIYKKNQTLL